MHKFSDVGQRIAERWGPNWAGQADSLIKDMSCESMMLCLLASIAKSLLDLKREPELPVHRRTAGANAERKHRKRIAAGMTAAAKYTGPQRITPEQLGGRCTDAHGLEGIPCDQ